MKKIIKKCLEDFMIDPIFNAIMYGLCTILFMAMIIMFIVICKQIF